MRGNERWSFPTATMWIPEFQIPMRGNEKIVVRPSAAAMVGFQIPMRGNEWRLEWQKRGTAHYRFKSP